MKTVFENKLGVEGRMISGSKSWYHSYYPKNLVLFNSNIFVEGKGKVWYGDIDLTLDRDKLIEIANELGYTLYVLRELDGRFENDNRKDFKQVAIWNTKLGLSEEYSRFYDENLLLRKEP